jgi:hypothetical protein
MPKTTRKNGEIKHMLAHHIWRYNLRNNTNISSILHQAQRGGGVAESHGMDVWENEDGSFIAIRVGKRRKAAYITLLFDVTTQTIELESFSTDRIVPGHIRLRDTKSKISDLFIEVVYDICKQKGAKKLALQDNSTLVCEKNNIKFKLADMYFLAHGKTWYESKLLGLQPDDDEINEHRKHVIENSWDDIMAILQKRNKQVHDEIQEYLKSLEPFSFSTNEKGAAMKVFRILKDTRMCEAFTRWMNYFLIASQIPSLYTSTWTLAFKN